MGRHNCFIPWDGMAVTFTGNVNVHCCKYRFSGFDLAPGAPLDIARAWNSPWFQEVRRIFVRDDLRGTGCEGCDLVKPAGEAAVPAPKDLNPVQEANFRRAVENYEARAVAVDHLPCSYQFDFGRQCNLRCIMCPQAEVRGALDESGHPPALRVEALAAQKEALACAAHVLLFGGEPLVIPESRRMMDLLLTDPDLRDVELRVVTNGLLLHDFLPRFRDKDRLWLAVSLDAPGPAYERIRRGGSWERLRRNLEELLDLRARLNRPWFVRINTVLMKSSLPTLPDLARWCVAHGVDDISFVELIPNRQTAGEDVFRDAALLDGIPGWADGLARARDILVAGGLPGPASTLERLAGRLERAPRQGSPLPDRTEIMQEYLRGGRIEGKRVAIWGTGAYYRIWLSKWLSGHREKIDFVGFFDNDPLRWGKECDGHPIYGPDKMKDLGGLDVVLVANPQIESISNQIRGMGIAMPEVI